MDDLINFSKQLQAFDLDYIFFEVWKTKQVQDFIVHLNTNIQMYEQGVNSLGFDLGGYKLTTIKGTSNFAGKKEKGQRYDHITLNDTNDLYKSYIVHAISNGFIIKADTIKDGTNLEDRFGVIQGLTEENEKALIDFIEPIFNAKATEKIR